MRSWFCFAIVALAAGCFVPDPPDGELRCNPTGKACPDGYQCVDGYCARGADGGVGVGPDAGPQKAQGEACGDGDRCASGHCVDGVCCDQACDGACQACDVGGAVGTCTTVSGAPHGGRACAGSGSLCGGVCDGSSAACSYPGGATVCGAACDGTCDGHGACSAGGGSCPGGYACGPTACLTSCAGDADCAGPNWRCEASACVRVPESDCLDGIDNNGDGQIDCDDPTCGDVECVPAVPAGDELGLLDPAGCNDPGFPTAEAQHQGLSQPSCKGCGCGVNHTCRVTGRLYSGAPNCSGSATAIPATFAGSNGDCAVVPVRVYEGVVIDPPVLVKAGCVGSGTATVDDPTFSRNTSFCAARRVSTGSCHGDATKVCAPKPKAPAAKMCVRVPGTGAGCPPGYSSGSSEVYYSGAQKATCGACTCDPASIIDARCGQPYLVGYKDQTCSQSGSARGFILDNNMCQVQYGGWGSPGTWFHDDTTGSVQTVSNPSTGSCTATAPTTPAVPTGASLICCQ